MPATKAFFCSHPAPQFLETLFDVARPNLRINGRTTEEPSEVEEDDNVEPFDEALDRHIWSLSDQRLKWDKDIAERRRTRPKDIEALLLAQQNSDALDVAQNETTYDFIAGEHSVGLLAGARSSFATTSQGRLSRHGGYAP